MQHGYNYETTLAASERGSWKLSDIIGGDKRIDFGKPFLPESLARVEPLGFLSPDERLKLNQIRGAGYLYTFGLVEEFILPFVLDHARPLLHGDSLPVRAFLQFAGEEAKHIDLFKRFAAEFEAGFGSPCEMIGPPAEIARAVLAHHPLAVALVILHIEWMTQRHYLESVKDDQRLDEQFKSLLRYHWMEEAQHAKLDTLIVETLAASCTENEISGSINGYLEIGMMLDAGLEQQLEFDLKSFSRATGRALGTKEAEQFRSVQRQALRWTFLGTGMTHRKFLQTVEELKPGAKARLEKIAPSFC